MAAIAANTKSYIIAPGDGWVEIVTGASTPINFLRISAYPHTHPIQVATGASAPAAGVPGITVCHHPFKVYDATNGISSLFWVKVNNPGNQVSGSKGGVRVDVYSEGGVLQ